jgi:hypothetical protein
MAPRESNRLCWPASEVLRTKPEEVAFFGQNRDEIIFGHNIRSDARQGDDPDSADDHLGFRVAIDYVKRDVTAVPDELRK